MRAVVRDISVVTRAGHVPGKDRMRKNKPPKAHRSGGCQNQSVLEKPA